MASYRTGLVLTAAFLMASSALAQPNRNELNSTGVPPGDYSKTLRSAAEMALPNNYDRDETWLKLPKGRVLGATSALDIDKDGKSIWLVERCAGGCTAAKTNPIMKFDATGKLVRSFGAGLLVYPHGMWVDREGNVWVADTQSNIERNDGTPNPAAANAVPAGDRVLKFSPTGKLLMQLGTTGHYGTDNAHFNQPSDVITAPNGDIFVADGHELTNTPPRIMKFDKTGKFIKAWDLCSTSTVPFDCSHSLAMDSQGRIFVADRGNSLVVIYDQDGKRLAAWKQFGKPSGLYIDKNDVLYAGDSVSSVQEGNAFIRGVHIGSARTGIVTGFIPDVLGNPTPWFPLKGTTGPEGVVADAEGHIFVSQVAPFGQVARYTLKPN
jgi:DNA-binding beta-propeller fold protein YncE